MILADRATAQTFTILHTFTGGSEVATPYASLALSGSTLYGTTQYGGYWGVGSVFAVNTDGSGFTNLYSCPDDLSAGYWLVCGLILSVHTLYGTTPYGGTYPDDGGTVFKLNTDGTGFTYLYDFSDYNNACSINSDGGQPLAGLILSGNTLYGTASIGGDYGSWRNICHQHRPHGFHQPAQFYVAGSRL